MASNDSVSKGMRILWYKRRLLALGTFIGFAVGAAIGLGGVFSGPSYRSHTTVTMLPSYTEITYTSHRSDFQGLNPALVLTQTQTEVLLSRTIARTVVDELIEQGMLPASSSRTTLLRDVVAQGPRLLLNAVYHLVSHGKLVIPSHVERLTNLMKSSISVQNVPGSYILNISVTWPDADVAARAANLLADIYLENTQSENSRAFESTRVSIEKRIGERYERLREVEASIRDVKGGSPVYYSLQSETPLQVKLMEDYGSERSRLEVKAIELRSRIDGSKKVGSAADTVALRAEYEAALKALHSLGGLIRRRQEELQKIPDLEYNLLHLEERKNEAREAIDALQASLVQAAIAEVTNAQSVRVIDPAVVPAYPNGPTWLLKALVSALAGLLLTLAWLLLSEPVFGTVRCYDDVSPLGFSFGGIMPRSNGKKRRRFFSWLFNRFAVGYTDGVLAKHADLAVANTLKKRVSLVESVAGPGRHQKALMVLMARLPHNSLVLNLDPAFDQALASRMPLRHSVSAEEEEGLTTLQLQSGRMARLPHTSPSHDQEPGSREESPGDIPLPRSTTTEGEGGPKTQQLYDGRVQYVFWRVRSTIHGPDDIQELIEKYRALFDTIVIVSPGRKRSPVAALLEKTVDSVLVLAEANCDKRRDLQHVGLTPGPGEPKRRACMLTGVQYPPDLLFT